MSPPTPSYAERAIRLLEIFRAGQPFGRIRCNGRTWDAVTEGELDAHGHPVPSDSRPGARRIRGQQ